MIRDFFHVFIQPVFIEHELWTSYCTGHRKLTCRVATPKVISVTHVVNERDPGGNELGRGSWASPLEGRALQRDRTGHGLREQLRGCRLNPPFLVTTTPPLKPVWKVSSMLFPLFALLPDIFPLWAPPKLGNQIPNHSRPNWMGTAHAHQLKASYISYGNSHRAALLVSVFRWWFLTAVILKERQ